MGFSIYRKTRSIRATITTPDGERIVVENLRADRGFRMSFDCMRSMTGEPAECTLRMVNLPPDVLGVLEAAQTTRVDDLDALLVGKALQSAEVAADGSDALAAGFLLVEVEAGFDGVMSRVFRCIAARSRTEFESDDVTLVTTISANENLDAAVLGMPSGSFTAGTPLFEVLDYLRRIAGCGPGNLSPANLDALIGVSRLDSPYHVSGGQALSLIATVLAPLPARWFIDDREIWMCARDGLPSPTGAVPWIADGPPEELEPLIGRPKTEDGGDVSVACLLCPRIRPGRLVRLTPAGLALAAQGLSPRAAQVTRAKVRPGLYRVEQIRHSGTTGPDRFESSMRLRAITLGTPGVVLSDAMRLLLDLGLAPAEVVDVGL